MKFDTLLFDADDTLFDFYSSGKKCFTETAIEFALPSDKIDYRVYSEISQALWDKLSHGETSKNDVLFGRFEQYKEVMETDFNVVAFEKTYEGKLANTCILFPETRPVLEKLKKDGYRIYVITNGVSVIQNTRLDLSGLRPILDGVFISDDIGFAKPSDEYFEAVKTGIINFNPSKALIIGDSLVSDIPLGLKNGIKVCRANYKKCGNPNSVYYDYEIFSLNDIFKIL